MAKRTATPAATQGKPGRQSTRAAGSATVATRKRSAEKHTASVRIVPEQRPKLIAQAAYFIAERRGFAPGNEVEDWLQAEAEIEALIKTAPQ